MYPTPCGEDFMGVTLFNLYLFVRLWKIPKVSVLVMFVPVLAFMVDVFLCTPCVQCSYMARSVGWGVSALLHIKPTAGSPSNLMRKKMSWGIGRICHMMILLFSIFSSSYSSLISSILFHLFACCFYQIYFDFLFDLI